MPELATSWKPSKNGLTWTFTLRKGVRFQDGTQFNAAAVCFNFNRWYNFPAPLQSDARELLLEHRLRRLRASGAGQPRPDKSLYKGCKAHGQTTASISS